jgi:hypothetical protein
MPLLKNHCPFCAAPKWRWQFSCTPCYVARVKQPVPLTMGDVDPSSPPPGAKLVASVTHTWGETAKPPTPVKLEVEAPDPWAAVFDGFDEVEDALGTTWPKHR